MITDKQTNFLYLPNTLSQDKYTNFYFQFQKTLKENKINFRSLPQTKDIWAVDYMPIQISLNSFIQFVYNPIYLKEKKYHNTISDVDVICSEIGIKTIKTKILLDGGNVIRSTNKVIITERIFSENRIYEPNELIKQLHELLEVDNIIVIPEQPNDFTGHADGMVRFLDDNTILINDYKRESKKFQLALKKAIDKWALDCIIIPYNPYYNNTMKDAKGIYINYLQMENIILIPAFGMNEDDKVLKQFEKIFLKQKIVPVPSNEIAIDGGILNCISWNIRVEA